MNDIYVLIHKNGRVIFFDECDKPENVTTTATLFSGTKSECETEIERLNLLTKVYTTQPRGKHYHLISCRYIQVDDNPVEWESVADAERAGFQPCSICIGV